MCAALVFVTGMALFGGSSAQAQAEDATTYCNYRSVEDGLITISDTPSAGWTPGIEKVVIERSVDGGRWWWRGRVESASPFVDVLPQGSIVEYRTRIVSGGETIEQNSCGLVDLTEGRGFGATCSTHAIETGSVSVSTARGDYLYQSQVLYRSVDDGPWYWRERIDFGGDHRNSNYDVLLHDRLIRFEVVLIAADGTRSERISCGDPVPFQAMRPVVTRCEFLPIGDMTVRAQDDYATAHVFYRSVDGGPVHWQARWEHTLFGWYDDRAEPGHIYEYWVEAVNDVGMRSERYSCGTAVVDGTIAILRAPTECSAVRGADGVVAVSWERGMQASYDVVERLGSGDRYHWRGRIEHADVATFDDAIPDALEAQYRVRSIDRFGRSTDWTDCI